jgi:hypothetical protein
MGDDEVSRGYGCRALNLFAEGTEGVEEEEEEEDGGGRVWMEVSVAL